MRFRFIHAADLHLDSPFRGLSHLPESILEDIRSSTFKAYDALIDLAIREKVDFVCIAGDVYDLAERSLFAQVAFQRGLERLAKLNIHAYIIHGNHDPVDGRQAKLTWPKTVHFFSALQVEGNPFMKEGKEAARIYGRSYPTAKFTERIVVDYVRDREVPFAIGLYHTNLDGDNAHEAYAPCSRKELLAQGMDYWALGHIHQHQVVQQNPWIVYAGNLQGRSVKETGAKGCVLVDVAQDCVTDVQFCSLDDIRWEQVDVDLTGVTTEQEALEKMDESLQMRLSEAAGNPLIARVQFTGETALHRLLKDSATLEDWNETCQKGMLEQRPWIWIESMKVKTKAPIHLETWRESDDFVGDFLRLIQGMRNDPSLSAAFEDVLKTVYQHRTVKKYIASLTEEEIADLFADVDDLALHLFIEKGESA